MPAHRLSELSCCEEMFFKASPKYKPAPRNSSFSENFNCLSHSTTYALDNKKKKKQSRNIIWFNPPFSDGATTNIGKEFFSLLAQHFPPSNRLHKTINTQNVKLNYSCLANMQGIIVNHKHVLNKSTPEE